MIRDSLSLHDSALSSGVSLSSLQKLCVPESKFAKSSFKRFSKEEEATAGGTEGGGVPDGVMRVGE